MYRNRLAGPGRGSSSKSDPPLPSSAKTGIMRTVKAEAGKEGCSETASVIKEGANSDCAGCCYLCREAGMQVIATQLGSVK